MRHEKIWVIGEQVLGPLEEYFSRALSHEGRQVTYHNIHELYPAAWRKAGNYFHRFPRRVDNSLSRKYVSVVNSNLVSAYRADKPSLIFIYNDCMITPESIDAFRRGGTKVVTLLGDDPCYLIPGKKTFLLTALASDALIVPDTGWIPGLKMLGARKIIFSPVGTDPSVFFPVSSEYISGKELYKSDIIFIGTGYYLNAWGIKRAEILNSLSGMNFRLFGDKQWHEVLEYFPELRKHFIEKRLSASEVNVACSCSKIYPVTVNSGVVNGVSTRIFDCIASGIFVLAEYKSDIDLLFENGEVATFRNKDELRSKAEYYLANESERLEMIRVAREKVLSDYTLTVLVKNVMEQV